jgi:hypothetical protein
MTRLKFLTLSSLAAASLAIAGCGTPNVNPPAPRAHTGYVDFYTGTNLSLSWEVKRADKDNGELRTVFLEYKPLEATILRLAVPPGSHRFQVWFMNQATQGPQTVQVEVENGKVTPVHITLTPAGTTTVETKVYGFRPSAKGYGRGTKIESEETGTYQIGAVAEQPRGYGTKEQMPYFVPAPK